MDIKQKRSILSAVFKAFALFTIIAVGWVGYYTINALVKNEGILWLNITILVLQFFVILCYLVMIKKTKKLKNLFGNAKFLFLIIFMTFTGIVTGIFLMYYKGYTLSTGYYLTISILLLEELFVILMLFVGLSLIKLYKNTTLTIDSVSEVPNYDDELMLKKKRDELNRKLEMKKVAEEIESMKKELGE